MARGDLKHYLETNRAPDFEEVLALGENMHHGFSAYQSDSRSLQKEMARAVAMSATERSDESATIYMTAEGCIDGARLQVARLTLREIVQREGFDAADATGRLDRDNVIVGFRLFWGKDPLEAYASTHNHGPTDFDFRGQVGLATQFRYF